MRALREPANRLLVQLFKHAPRLASVWARRYRAVEAAGIPWTPVRKPLGQSTVALLTTAGVHLRSQAPFVMDDPDGDPSFRIIPVEAAKDQLVITHKYYDHTAADRDINVVLPLDRMRELQAAGRIGTLAPLAYGFMGHIDGPHLRTLLEVSAPEVARRLRQDGAEAAVLTPA